MTRQNLLHRSIALLGLAVGGAAFGAQPTAPTPAPSVTATTSAPDDLICRNRLRPGSHIKMRICMTAAQWAAPIPQGFMPEGIGGGVGGGGPWGAGAISTTGASVGVSAFTAR